jgi:integrase
MGGTGLEPVTPSLSIRSYALHPFASNVGCYGRLRATVRLWAPPRQQMSKQTGAPVQAIAGHSNPLITLKRYGHLLDDRLIQAADRFDPVTEK